MDISKLTHGAKLVLGGSIAFLIVSIFNWQEVEYAGIASAGRSMWSGVGVIAGLLAIVLIVWEIVHIANMKIDIGVSPAIVGAVLAILLAVFTFIKFVSDNEFRTFWAWLGLALAIAVAVGAFLNMKATGLTIAEMKGQVAGAAASATAAAKSATDSAGDKAGDAKDAVTGGGDTAQDAAADAGQAAQGSAADAADTARDAASDAADEHRPS